MMSFRLLWAGPISDYPLASRIVIGAGLALPAMFVLSEAGITAMSQLLFGSGALHWSRAIGPAIAIVCLGALSGWLIWRKSKTASIIILLLTGVVAVVLDVFEIWMCRMVPGLLFDQWTPLSAMNSMMLVIVMLMAMGWSTSAFLSWRAVKATFAAESLRSSAQSELEAFD